MKLYYSPGACSLAARITLHELDIETDFERVDLQTKVTEAGHDFRDVNPLGYVPALELDDGSIVTENVAILPYIADLRPGVLAPLAGSLDRVRLYQTLGFLAGELRRRTPVFWGPRRRWPGNGHRQTQVPRRSCAAPTWRWPQLPRR